MEGTEGDTETDVEEVEEEVDEEVVCALSAKRASASEPP